MELKRKRFPASDMMDLFGNTVTSERIYWIKSLNTLGIATRRQNKFQGYSNLFNIMRAWIYSEKLIKLEMLEKWIE